MNKTAIKNFAVWARNKLIADISYRAGLMGITESGIASALPQSTGTTEFYDIGTAEPYAISGDAVRQRRRLVELIERKIKETDYKTAYKYIIEEVAYTWFNRLIAIRFMEVNDYLPSHIRVLSSESGKMEPDLVTNPFDAELDFTKEEERLIILWKQENRIDDLFNLLFVKQCNSLNSILPALFEKLNDYTELLLNLSVIDKEGVIYHLINDIPEEDFNVENGGQVEIIGWLYQYYNTELKEDTFSLLKKSIKVSKERIPSATQLFTPDWIVRYMVENSLGRLWLEGHPNGDLQNEWSYYLNEASQNSQVLEELRHIRREYRTIDVENIKVIDPCMGSGHILIYAFDILMQIYESVGYSARDAAKSILENNLYGLDIDKRAFQLAYFSLCMKARQYNRRIFNNEIKCNLYSVSESNAIERQHICYFGKNLPVVDRNEASKQLDALLNEFKNAEEYGSLLKMSKHNWELLEKYIDDYDALGQITFQTIGIEETVRSLNELIQIGRIFSQKYDVVITNPPYMGRKSLNDTLSSYMENHYSLGKAELYTAFILKCMEWTKKNGFTSMITMHTWMFISTFEAIRKKVLSDTTITSMVHTGAATFEELNSFNVLATAFVLQKNHIHTYCSKFIRLANYYDSEEKIRNFFEAKNVYVLDQKEFEVIPGIPYVYWVSNNARNIFTIAKPIRFYSEPKVGLQTGDNGQFVRYWFEVADKKICFDAKNIKESVSSEKKWFPYNKGGDFRKWYGMNEYVVNWEKDGLLIRNFKDSKGKLRSRPQNVDYYFKKGITWSLFGFENFGVRYKNEGFVFDVSGSSLFPDERLSKYILAFLASKVAFMYLSVLAPTVNFQAGNIGDLPLLIDNEQVDEISGLSEQCIHIAKDDWDDLEISWDYKGHPLTRNSYGKKLSDKYEEWVLITQNRFENLRSLEESINEKFIKIYKLENDVTPEVVDRDIAIHIASKKEDMKNLLSYAVGCMFGRYSVNKDGLSYAGGEWNDNNYSNFLPDTDGIIPITDEEYLNDDIVSRLCAWLKCIYGEALLEENLDFIADSLETKGNSSREKIRNYFLKEFFVEHYKMYSKIPIYWMFDSGKQNGFKALIYMHRYSANTIGNLRVDYLHKMQRIYESEINRMQDMIDHSANTREVAAATKRKEKLQKQLKECREYDEKIGHLALSRINIDLDDGVKTNYEKVQTASDGKKYQVLAKI